MVQEAMQFEYVPEKLIEAIKRRPGIWDFESVEYRAKNQRARLWTEVVKELNQTTQHVTKSEIRELKLQLQKKWKGIRNCFQKYISHPERTRRPYIYNKQLRFLLKGQDQQSVNENNSSSESDDEANLKTKRLKWKKTIKVMTGRDNNTDDDDNDDDNGQEDLDTNFSDYESPAPKITKIKQSTDQFAIANVDAIPKPDDNDSDRLFLLSLLPHLKTIPEEFRLSIKIELMQVLQNANYNATRDHKIM